MNSKKKLLINNYTTNKSLSENNNQNNIFNPLLLDKSKRKDSLEDKSGNIYLKNSNFNKKKLAEDFHNRRKRLEEIDEEQERLNNKMKYEFRDMINEPYSPIVYLNQDEIDQIKNNNDYINMKQ